MESIPLTKLPSSAEDIHNKTREASQNPETIQSELVNNVSELTGITEHIKKDSKGDPTFSEEQSQMYKDNLEDLDTE